MLGVVAGVCTGVPSFVVEGGETGTGGGIGTESTSSSNRFESSRGFPFEVEDGTFFDGVEGGLGVETEGFEGGGEEGFSVSVEEGAGVASREGGTDMLEGRGARGEGSEGPDVRVVAVLVGVVPVRGRGFEGERVREEGVR